ncbi:MAG: hypothetical protein E6I38_08375 [Chloroflexi bacterium]|nr:MAG: hypothetical protein E6I38_08375 [Chloroflexota bacterium]
MTTLPATPAASGHRSTLVTVVAWVFLILSALATLGALMNVLILAVMPAATVDAIVSQVTQDTAVTHLLPAPYQFMMHHARLVALIKLVWWAAVLIASVGILQRREWARRTFVATLGIEIIVVILAFVMSQSMLMGIASQRASQSRTGQVPPGMGTGMALGGLLGVGIVAILLWLLLTFRSARVRNEFTSAERAA